MTEDGIRNIIINRVYKQMHYNSVVYVEAVNIVDAVYASIDSLGYRITKKPREKRVTEKET